MLKSLFKVLALVLFLGSLAWAEDPPNPQVAVLDPSTGKVLGHYLMMRRMREYIEAGTEDPHFAYLKTFCFDNTIEPNKLVDENGRQYMRSELYVRDERMEMKKVDMGALPDGRHLVWFAKNGGPAGPLKIVDFDGSQRVLLADRRYEAPGWRPLLRPGACVAYPYLLAEQPEGADCRSISSGKVLWKAKWKFGHCRWNLGAWYTGDALFVDSEKGLSRVNPDTGKILWTWPDAVELLRAKVYPDGLLYVEFQYGPKDMIYSGLAKQAEAHYKWPADHRFSTRAIPYKAGYFGATWEGNDYLKDGKVAVWERIDGKWRFIFDYPCSGQSEADLDKLYAKYQLSSRMRKLLTTDSTATVYFDRNGKMEPDPER